MFRLLVASFLFTACAFSGERRVHFLSALDAPDEEVLFFLKHHLLMNETTGVSFANFGPCVLGCFKTLFAVTRGIFEFACRDPSDTVSDGYDTLLSGTSSINECSRGYSGCA